MRISLGKKKALLFACEAVVYCLAGLSLFNILWFFVQDINSTIVSIATFLPYYLSSLLPFYLLIALHVIRHPSSEKGKKMSLFWHGIALSSLSFIALLLYIIYLSTGIYKGLIIHRAGPLFPLSGLLWSFLSLAIGIAFILFGTKLFLFEKEEACPKKKYHLASSILLLAYSLFACGFAGDFILFPILMDYSLDNFFLCLPTLILMVLPSLYLLRREIFATFLSVEVRRPLGLRFILIEGAAGLIFALWMAIGLACKSMFIVESMTSFFPIDFMGSMAIGPYALFFLSLLYPPLSLLFYLKRPIE
jgi:hypothetical protein